MSFERALFENFQRHERLPVDFDGRVTTITGPSDIGKSSIIRAIRWLCLNRPDGTGFIRWGQKGMVVRLKVDGRTIKRERSDKTNLYWLDDQRYEAFGRGGVPDEIAKLLNVGDGNFQMQHDPVWWFSMSPPEVARQLNKIVDLEVIDEVVADLASRSRKLTAERDVCRERLESAKKAKTGLTYVLSADKDLQKLEVERWRIDKDNVSVSSLVSLVADCRTIWAVGQQKRTATRQGQRALELGIVARDSAKVASDLTALTKDISAARQKTRLRQAAITGAEVVELGRVAGKDGNAAGLLRGLIDEIRSAAAVVAKRVPDIGGLERAKAVVEKSRDGGMIMRQLVQQVKVQRKALEDCRRRAGEAEIIFDRETEGRCPICGGAL